MMQTRELYHEIDKLVEKVEKFKTESLFNKEKNNRQQRQIFIFKEDKEILKRFSHLIAFSQNANSEVVDKIINSGKLDIALEHFDIDRVATLNPCDIADNHWASIGGIRQQAKLFHIVSVARKLKRIGSFCEKLNNLNIPSRIKSENDMEQFWNGFDELLKILKNNKISFFQSTTSLLHFLLDIGYDCVKPDLVVMKVAKKLNIVEDVTGDKNFRKTVRVIQEYALFKNIRPSVVDLYFLIDGKQKWAKNFVNKEFYKE